MCPDINPSLPAVGQPNSSEDPKILTALTTIIGTINNLDTANLSPTAGILDTQLGSSPSGTWRTMAESVVIVGQSVTAGVWTVQEAGVGVVASGSNQQAAGPVYLDPAEFSPTRRTPKLRLKVAVIIAGPPGTTLTYGLYPVGAISGGSNMAMTLGTVVFGSTWGMASPPGNTVQQGNSGAFSFPTVGAYVFGVALTGNMAASSQVPGYQSGLRPATRQLHRPASAQVRVVAVPGGADARAGRVGLDRQRVRVAPAAVVALAGADDQLGAGREIGGGRLRPAADQHQRVVGLQRAGERADGARVALGELQGQDDIAGLGDPAHAEAGPDEALDAPLAGRGIRGGGHQLPAAQPRRAALGQARPQAVAAHAVSDERHGPGDGDAVEPHARARAPRPESERLRPLAVDDAAAVQPRGRMPHAAAVGVRQRAALGRARAIRGLRRRRQGQPSDQRRNRAAHGAAHARGHGHRDSPPSGAGGHGAGAGVIGGRSE
jgi:hypothetical protein